MSALVVTDSRIELSSDLLASTGLFGRPVTAGLDTDRCTSLVDSTHRAAVELCDVAGGVRRRLFFGRPLVCAAERRFDTVELVHFAPNDWSAFVFSSEEARTRSYELYQIGQSIIRAFARQCGYKTTVRAGRGAELVMGAAVGQ